MRRTLIDVDATRLAINESGRHLLGSTQMAWLKGRLTNSTARWQVLGQQVLMARIHLPSPIMEALEPSLAGDDFVAKGTAAVLAAVAAKNTPADERSNEQRLCWILLYPTIWMPGTAITRSGRSCSTMRCR